MATLTKQDIELALDRIDKEGIPARNRSTGYCLEAVERGKRHYPPKHVLRLAYASINEKLPFRGGPAANSRLIALGYKVFEHKCRNDNLQITD
jgi:hypothetical protein